MSFPGSSRGRGPDPSGHVVMSAGRGAVLVGVAVIVGLLVLLVVDNSGPSTTPVSDTSVTTPTVPATNADGTPVTTTETTETTKAKKSSSKNVRANDQVVVQVLNGSGLQGAATTRTNDLKAKGYQTLPAGNAPAQRDGNAVQCQAGYENEGEALVAALGEVGVTASVEALPDPLPADFNASANCYVLLGR